MSGGLRSKVSYIGTWIVIIYGTIMLLSRIFYACMALPDTKPAFELLVHILFMGCVAFGCQMHFGDFNKFWGL